MPKARKYKKATQTKLAVKPLVKVLRLALAQFYTLVPEALPTEELLPRTSTRNGFGPLEDAIGYLEGNVSLHEATTWLRKNALFVEDELDGERRKRTYRNLAVSYTNATWSDGGEDQ